MKFIIATHNKKKLAEMERILNPLGVEVSTAQLQEVDETGATFADNAYLKASAACKETGLPAIADDSGLAVDALNGAPGIYSARYAGEHATDLQKMEKLLRELKDVPKEKRTARFVCSICCVFPNGDCITAEGACEGNIAFELTGDGGLTQSFWWENNLLVSCPMRKKTVSATEEKLLCCFLKNYKSI